mgnify:FL=1
MNNLVLAVMLGAAFGFALYNAGAGFRANIRAMLTGRDTTLMKTILFGIGFASSLLAISIFSGFLDLRHLSIKPLSLAVPVGGLIFGVGFGYLGNCPGTVLASLPYRNKVKTLGVLVGGIFGAWLYALTFSFWQETGIFGMLDLGKTTLFRLSPSIPSVLEVGPEGLFLLGGAFMVVAALLPRRLDGKA